MSCSILQNDKTAKIKVIGVGGAGNNAINNMIEANLAGVQFIAANTDSQALETSKASVKIQIGSILTEGLGAGANPEGGKQAAMENENELREALADSHMVFITAGFGGGTGTGAAPIIAEICKEQGALTVAVVSKPFSFEGKKRFKQAEQGIAELNKVADTVITIPNDRLRGIAPKDATMISMFKKADEILHHSVKGITDLIMVPGLINLDFADVKTTMRKAGMALMGIGVASGENRALEAAEKAISHPLLEDLSIAGAKGVLMNITCTSDLTMNEMTEASDRIHQEVGEDAEIIWGTAIDETLGDEIRITVIATGIGEDDALPENVHSINTIVQQEPEKVHAQMGAHTSQTYDSTYGGKVRDLTPEEQNSTQSVSEPVLIRSSNIDDTNIRSLKGVIMDNDLDIPTFLRKQAD